MTKTSAKSLRIPVSEKSGDVCAVLLRPGDAKWLYVLGHGAGAGMHHVFLETVARKLAERDVATLRYQFPYTENGKRRPDSPPVLQTTIRAALEKAVELAPDLPLVAGGKSMGGRLTSVVAAKDRPEALRGLVFLGFPLHAPGRPSDARAAHLTDVRAPMLFLQGTRDKLADLSLLEPVCKKLGKRATLHIVEGGDHSFKVPKRTGRTEEEVFDELADTIAGWAKGRV